MILKTRVYKHAGKWRCEYYFPYSGVGYFEFNEWFDAMAHAWSVEEQKTYV